jgi:enoyl-CoA hydratase/carnithine racemase
MNAINLEMWEALSAATQRAEDDADVRVCIITGAGERAFSAGADVGSTVRKLLDMAAGEPFDPWPLIVRGQDMTKPLIAAINGLALGGGLEMALACDIRIAVPRARFGLPEVGLGVIPGWGGTQRLQRQVPRAVAARMVLTGEMIGADEALAFGLINAVVEPDVLIEEAQKIAQGLCTKGPLALRAAKRAMSEGASMPLSEGLAFEWEVFTELMRSADAKEGITAFEEGRPPEFSGM